MHTEAFRPARPALLEREPEVSAIRDLVHAARAGTGGLLVAEGSLGTGKTRLLAEARAAAEASGLEVVALARPARPGSGVRHRLTRSRSRRPSQGDHLKARS